LSPPDSAEQNKMNLIKMIQSNEIDDKTCSHIIEQFQNEKRISRFHQSIRKQYINLVLETSIKGCTKTWQTEIGFSANSLHNACYEIETDLRILLIRRKNLIGKDKKTESALPTRGKIAGVVTYRLARANIIHLSPGCIRCNNNNWIEKNNQPCPITTLNTEIAIYCGLYFINKKYGDIPKEVRNEIIYTLNKRHTNQETLGIVFDTIKTLL